KCRCLIDRRVQWAGLFAEVGPAPYGFGFLMALVRFHGCSCVPLTTFIIQSRMMRGKKAICQRSFLSPRIIAGGGQSCRKSNPRAKLFVVWRQRNLLQRPS